MSPSVPPALRRWSRTDGVLMAAVGLIAALRGWSYTTITTTPSLRSSHVMESWLPLNVWSVVWFAIAAVCFVGAVRYQGPIAAAGVGSVAGLHFLFGLSFLYGTLSGESARGWVSAISYIGIAVLIILAVVIGGARDRERKKPGGAAGAD